MKDYDDFRSYFYSRHRWIFSLMTILFIADFADTLLKGNAYLHTLGPAYYLRTAVFIVFSAVAIKVRDERFHAGFAILATTAEILLILKDYMTVT